MPRQTQTAVTRSAQGQTYATTPSVQSQVVARPVGDRTIGLRMLSQSLSGFFGDVQGAFKTVQDAEFMKEKVKIEQENQQQQWEAHKRGIMGGELSSEEQKDLDYVTPYNQAKAGRAALEDSSDFVNNVLPNIGIDGDPFQALNEYMGTKLEGIQNKQYGAFYADAMLRATSEAIDKSRANAITAKKYEVQEDWKAQLGMKLKTGLITTPEQLMMEIGMGGRLNNPANPIDGERWAVTKALEIARTADADGTLMTSLVEMLQQPVDPSPENPEGLSFATRFPDGFNDIVRTANKNSDAGYDNMVSEQSFKIDQKIAEGDIAGAIIEISHGRGMLGDSQFRDQELQITRMIADGADERAAIDGLLLDTGAGSAAADPATVDKYGDKALKLAIEQGGAAAGVKYMRQWNTIPKGFRTEIERNLTKTSSPEAMAAYYTQVAGPMMETMPTALLATLDDDAEWVLRYMHDEQMLRNVDPLQAAREAATTLDEIKKQGLDPKNVKLWDDKPGAQAEFYKTLKEDLGDKFGNVGIIDALNPWGNSPVVIPDHLMSQVFVPAIQRRALKYMAAGHADAISKATEEIMDGAGSRLLYLPNADGDTYLAEDNTPDTAAKWQKRELPDGTIYDPVEEFRKTAADPQVSFLAGGAPLELRPGRNASADGGMEVWGPDGMPITFGMGQKIEWSVVQPRQMAKDAQGRPLGYLDLTTGGVQQMSMTLPDDEVAAENMLTEMFGTTGFRLAKIGEGAWQVEFVETGQKAVDLDKQIREKDLQNLLEEEEKGLPSIGQQLSNITSRAFNKAMAQPQSGLAGMLPNYEGYTELFGGFIKIGNPANRKALALEDQARQIVTKLQDAGMLPTSVGSTVPFPEFKDASDVIAFLRAEMSRKQAFSGGMPMENLHAHVDNRYAAIRYKSLKAYEGVRDTVYKDTVGVPTVGIGINLNMDYNVEFLEGLGVDVGKLKKGEIKLTEDQIQLSFENAVAVAEGVVSKKIKVPLNSYQRSALVSLAYNGPKLLDDKLVDAINAGKFRTAAALIAKKKINKTRRQKEARDFLRGVPRRLEM